MSVDKPVRPASEINIRAAISLYGDRRVQKALHNSEDNHRRVDAEMAYILGLLEARDAEVRAAALEEAKLELVQMSRDEARTISVPAPRVVREDRESRHMALLEALDRIKALATRSTEEPAPEEKD